MFFYSHVQLWQFGHEERSVTFNQAYDFINIIIIFFPNKDGGTEDGGGFGFLQGKDYNDCH